MTSDKLLSFNEFCNENFSDPLNEGGGWSHWLHLAADAAAGVIESIPLVQAAGPPLVLCHAITYLIEGSVSAGKPDGKINSAAAYIGAIITLGSLMLPGPAKAAAIEAKVELAAAKEVALSASKAGAKHGVVGEIEHEAASTLGKFVTHMQSVVAGLANGTSTVRSVFTENLPKMVDSITKMAAAFPPLLPIVPLIQGQNIGKAIDLLISYISQGINQVKWFLGEISKALKGQPAFADLGQQNASSVANLTASISGAGLSDVAAMTA